MPGYLSLLWGQPPPPAAPSPSSMAMSQPDHDHHKTPRHLLGLCCDVGRFAAVKYRTGEGHGGISSLLTGTSGLLEGHEISLSFPSRH